MTSPTHSTLTLDFITDELRQIYTAILLQIAQELKMDEQEELQFLCTHEINSGTTTATLNTFIKLEHIEKLSWENVRFLKENLVLLLRLDLVKTLTEFEIKRDMTLLLGLYASKRQGREENRRFSTSVEKLSEYLLKVTEETSRDGGTLDLSSIRSFLEEEGIKKVLVEFEDEIEREFTSDPWSKLTMLVVIAGEIVFEAFANGEHRQTQDVVKLCFITADKLCYRMKELRSGWEEFCNHLEKQYRSVYHQPAFARASSLLEKKKIAHVVQQLKETAFFLETKLFAIPYTKKRNDDLVKPLVRQ